MVRAVVDWRGQIVTMADRAYLTEEMPMAVVWGREDKVIPVRHASNAAALAPKARIEVIPNAGHFPHKDHPQRFAQDPARLHPHHPPGVVLPGQVAPALLNGEVAHQPGQPLSVRATRLADRAARGALDRRSATHGVGLDTRRSFLAAYSTTRIRDDTA